MAASDDERELIERSRRGDMAAFDILVRRYEKHIFSVAYRFNGSYEDAADSVQETFLRAWNNLKSFRGDAAFSTWLHRIATNYLLDSRKRSRLRPQRSLDEVIALEENNVARQYEDTSPTLQEHVEGQERQEVLAHAIMRLPEAQRIMVLLYHTEGRSYEEIVEITGMPMGTVKSRLNRARLALREMLAPSAELFGVSDSPK